MDIEKIKKLTAELEAAVRNPKEFMNVALRIADELPEELQESYLRGLKYGIEQVLQAQKKPLN